MERPIRVVVAMSVALFADAISALLQTDPGIELVGEIATDEIPRGLEQAEAPDVVLVDCLFNAESCPKLLHRLGEVFPSTRALVVCRDMDEDSLANLVAAGALGCVTPNCRRAELISAIRRVGQGEVLFPATLLMRLLVRQQGPPRMQAAPPDPVNWNASVSRSTVSRVPSVGPPVALAPRERQVLATLATGLTTEESAELLGITIHTVRTHLKNVMVKLNAHSKLEAVIIALRAGLIELPG